MMRRRSDRGAAAVEFALVIPILLLLVFGGVEFARLYNEQISLTNAARAAVRTMAIGNSQGPAVTAAIQAAPSLNPSLAAGNVSFSPAACPTSGGTSITTMTVTVSYQATLLTGLFGATLPLSGEAATPCGG